MRMRAQSPANADPLDRAALAIRPIAIERNEATPPSEKSMTLLLYYVGLVLAGDVAIALLCLAIEKVWPAPSLPIFITLYFLLLWVAWLLAVRLTAPKAHLAGPVGATSAPRQ